MSWSGGTSTRQSSAVSGPAKRFPRVNVLGVGITALDLKLAVSAFLECIDTNQKGYVCVTGVHGVSESQSSPSFKKILNEAYLNVPDGMPMVWMGKFSGHRKMDRVYGPDLMLRVFAASEETGIRHFFYGGAPGVADDLKSSLNRRFPKAQVVGTYTPPFRPLNQEEERELVERVSSARPNVVWVGLSTPKQEIFMSEYLLKLDTNIMVGVGAAFDFHSGRVRQAPHIVQRSGLEWLFRLSQDPRRLWKRYLKNNPLFVLRALSQQLRIIDYPLD